MHQTSLQIYHALSQNQPNTDIQNCTCVSLANFLFNLLLVDSLSLRVSPPSLHANEEMLSDSDDEDMDTHHVPPPACECVCVCVCVCMYMYVHACVCISVCVCVIHCLQINLSWIT